MIQFEKTAALNWTLIGLHFYDMYCINHTAKISTHN